MAEIRFKECDEEMKRRVGEAMGEVAERHLHLSDGFTIVALHGDRPVGVISVCRRRLPAPVPETYEGFIDIIQVEKEFRRMGIARRMIAESIRRAREEGLYQLRAWSSEDKAEAIPMWKALGFGLCPATTFPRGQEIKGFFATYRTALSAAPRREEMDAERPKAPPPRGA